MGETLPPFVTSFNASLSIEARPERLRRELQVVIFPCIYLIRFFLGGEYHHARRPPAPRAARSRSRPAGGATSSTGSSTAPSWPARLR